MTHPSDSIEDRRQKPWAMVETDLLRDPSITPQHKALYGLLITYGPKSIFPGHETLAECIGASRSTIIRWLNEMRASGLIDWVKRTGTSNRYYILGYENYTKGVAPVEQGCSTGDTGGVARVTHDLDPPILNQEQEEPAAPDSPPVVDSDADATAALFKPPQPRSQEPPEKRVARMRDELGDNPLQVAAVVEQNRAAEQNPDWTVPIHRGLSPACAVFKEATGYAPPGTWRDEIDEHVIDNPEGMKRWYDTCFAYVGCGWNPRNVKAMLDYYVTDQIPETGGGKANGGPSGGRHRAGGHVEPRIAASTVTVGGAL